MRPFWVFLPLEATVEEITHEYKDIYEYKDAYRRPIAGHVAFHHGLCAADLSSWNRWSQLHAEYSLWQRVQRYACQFRHLFLTAAADFLCSAIGTTHCRRAPDLH